ncbi:23609_t:CDS:2, partial [Dentiscutata erythropus]
MALKEFVLTYQHKTVLSDLILIEKAKLLANRLGVPVGILNFSLGWLQKFKERNRIGREKLYGEDGSVNENIIIRELLLLRNKYSDYPLERIYNIDETALFYQLEPDYLLATQLPLFNELLIETPLLEVLSQNLNNLNFPDAIYIEEYLAIPEENIVYKVPNKDEIIINLIETFRRTDAEYNKNQEMADDSIEKEIISLNVALKSLKNIHTYLLQQEDTNKCI